MSKRKILIRFDDICPTMDFEQFERALLILKKYKVSALLGVIPDCRDKDLQIERTHTEFWEYIKKLENLGCTIAMHGCFHSFDINARGRVDTEFKSEFAGHPYEKQYEKIQRGKSIFEAHSIKSDVFFAPAHSYDDNTLRALASNGFKYVSDGMSFKPVKRFNVVCIPCKARGCPKIKRKGYYTAVFHAHEWVRNDKKQGFEDLKNLCEQYKEDIVPFYMFANQPLGNTYIQNLIEFLSVRYYRYLRPILVKIKCLIVK